MNKTTVISLALLITPIWAQADNNPNIVLINVDDMGWADLSCYGNQNFSTPNIDSLALAGVRMTDFYAAAPVSTPSRAALLTGQYPIENNMHSGVIHPFTTKGLSPDAVTIAEVLQEDGYITACVGKWHLGHSDPKFMPNNQGFDYYYGIPYSNDMDGRTYKHFQAPPLPIYKDKKIVESGIDQRFLTTRFTDVSVEFIEKNQKRPFFLYLAHPMPHTPVHVSPKFMHSSKYGVYGDTVQELDWGIGQVINCLKQCGLYDNTIIIFTSDNGPDQGAWTGVNNGKAHPLRGAKAQTWEGGMRVPCIMVWSGHIEAGSTYCDIATNMDFFPTLASIAGCNTDGLKLDGDDIIPMLSDPRKERVLYYYATKGGLEAVRCGRWKLHVAKTNGWDIATDGVFMPQLYDMENDAAESRDMSYIYPQKVKELSKLIDDRNALYTKK